MDTIFKSDVDKYKLALDISSSDEEEDLGMQIQKKKKEHMTQDIADKETKKMKKKGIDNGDNVVTALFEERCEYEERIQSEHVHSTTS